jgi:hypothetical protein
MLPKATLPDGPLPAGDAHPGTPLGGRDGADEADLDRLDTIGKVIVALGQRDDAVHILVSSEIFVEDPGVTG